MAPHFPRPPDSGETVVRAGAFSALLERVFKESDGREAGAAVPFHAGQVVGRFELGREIGRGGFGVVYEARDLELRRHVAFKAVRIGGAIDARKERLLREAEAAARLAHPNIVTLYDVGHCDQGPYLVLELLRGETLEAELRRRRAFTVHAAMQISVEVAKGLAHAHAHGVVHRDLTPRNVFLCDDGQVKILDFGLAHAFGQRKVDGGTAAYMAPEQLSDAPEDERTDVFALGVILHQTLTGELPVVGVDAHASASSLAKAAGDWRGLPELIGRMLEKSPLQRPRDGGAVLAELIRIEQAGANSPAGRAVRDGRGAPRTALPQPRTKQDRRTRHNRTAARKHQCQRLKLAHAKAAGTPIDLAATRLATIVSARTHGTVDITVCPAAQLGDEHAVMQGVQLGTIDLCFASAGATTAFASEFQVIDLPYLFPSAEAAYTYLDGEHGKKLLGLCSGRRMHGIGFLENGWRSFTSTRRLRRPEDLRGLKIRVMESPVYMAIVRALGATPVPIAYPDLPKALQQRTVDGQENPPVNIYSSRMFLWQPYMVIDQHAYHVVIVAANGELWDRLSNDARRAVELAFEEVQAFQRKLSGSVDREFVRLLEAKGMDVYVPTAVELKAWHKATARVYADTRSYLGGSWVTDALQFRRQWDAGDHALEAERYGERFARLDVPVEAVLRSLQ
jgi:tripartite ATP-independent transporter DctP family solute receptor